MRLAYAFLADAAEFTPNGKMHVLGGGFDTVSTSSFPLALPLVVVVIKLIVDAGEPSRIRTIRLSVLGPGGRDTPMRLEMAFPTPPNPAFDAGLGFAMHVVNAQFPEPGTYTFRLDVDGLELARLPLRVHLEGVPPAPEGRR